MIDEHVSPQQMEIADGHLEKLNVLREMATMQEVKVYQMMNNDWKAQLKPEVREWMQEAKRNIMNSQKLIKYQQNSKLYSEQQHQDSYSMTYDLDEYFQL